MVRMLLIGLVFLLSCNVEGTELEGPQWARIYDFTALQMNIYHEARGEMKEGQEAVAWVTLNRVDSPCWPDSIQKVVYEPWQFSWTVDDYTDAPQDIAAWTQAAIVAYNVIARYVNGEPDPTNGSMWYHRSDFPWKYANDHEVSMTIGHHVFYNKAKQREC